jgi:hypothetical protein
MFYVLQNESNGNLRRVPILLTDAATGTTAQVGIAISTIYPYVNINGGAFAGGAGTVGEAGYGQYYYQMDPTEIGTLGLAGIHITAATCRDYDAIAQIAAFNVYSASVGATAGDIWAYDISAISAAGSAGTQLNLAAAGGAGLTAGDVWSYVTREITGGTATTVTNPVLVDPLSMTGIAGTVWSTDISAFTSPSAGYDLTQAAAGGGVTAYAVAQEVWNTDVSAFTTPSAGFDLTQASSAAGATAFAVAQAVWDYDPALYNFGSSGEYLAETRTEAYAASNNTNDIGNQVWNRDPVSTGDNLTGDYFSAYLYQLGTGTTGYPSAGGGISAYDVWSFDYLASGVVVNSAAERLEDTRTEAYAASNNTFELANKVWGNDLAAGAFSPYGAGTAGTILYELSLGGGGITAGGVADAVWNSLTSSYTTSGTFGFNTLRSDVAGVAGTVTLWTGGAYSGIYADTYRIDEDYNAAIALKNILTGVGSTITGNIDGDLLGSVVFVVDDVTLSAGTQASIANSVWSTLTAPYTTHATFGHNLLRSDNAATIGEVTLHQSGGSKRVDADVHAFVNNTASATAMLNILTGIGSSMTTNITGNITGNLSGSVGSVTNPVSVATASMTGIAGTVWSVATRTITGGTITTVSDKTGYSLSGTQSFNLTGNITGSVSGSVGSVSGSVGSVVSAVTLSAGTQSSIANSVWLTNISGYGAGSAGNALLNAGGGGVAVTAGDIWTYNTRTLTAGGGITAGDVWTYNISAITNSGTAGKQLNDASVSGSVVTIVNGPYTLNSTAEGTDGRIDILQDSVQTIELMLVNAFGSPINIAGNYTVSVDIYDEASALVHSYTPTINYALGGILSFDLDTLVTANIGRYSVVVSLTDGDVIQVGPLQILVRPL